MLIPTHGKVPVRPPQDFIWDFGGETMGTTWAVRLVPPPGVTRAALQSAIEDELDRIILLFSHWEPRSELSRLNAAPPGFWAVSEPFWTLLNAALDLADDTNGAVDPTLGALVDLWGFGPSGPRPMDAFGKGHTVPFEEEIAAAKALSGWGRLRLNRDARAVQQLGGVKLDLSGIAKGHAVDKVSERLVDNGVASVTVLAETAMYADAMATALTVMGPEEGPAFAEAMNIAAAFVVRGEDGLTETLTPAFVAMLSEGA